ncbi:MAG: N-acetyl-gamma-glutamyl-phosphate reductase [Deltaproteobacteria bacterium]|nr:N-acetyl-gamma-glutamyl-phosphate reductase [Deltaproteobacteria bacterium]
MDRARVFIDGHVGTTGLRIRDWLEGRADLELLSLDEGRRKDESARRALLEQVDLAVLCLPDEAARQAAGWLEGSDTKLVDASTAHRVDESWVFGLPEMTPDQRDRIRGARLVSNPGCYPTAVVLALRPLIEAGLLASDAPVSVRAVSGYSGGGRALIERWQDAGTGLLNLVHDAPYAIDRVHKHVPEMTRFSGLEHSPAFVPSVGPFRTGMRVEMQLHQAVLAPGAGGKRIWEALDSRYAGEVFVRVMPFRDPFDGDEHTFDPRTCNDTNRIDLSVVANAAGHVWVVGVLDNLGKGAAGQAIQNLNLMLGRPEAEGLRA